MANQFHLADLFESVAAAVPDRIALATTSDVRSFADLDVRASRIAAGLARRGIGRGDTVGLLLLNQLAHLEAFIAVIKLGAIPFNVNYRYGDEELAYLFDNAKAAAVIHGAQWEAMMARLQPRLPALRLRVSVADGIAAETDGAATAWSDLVATDAPPSRWPRDETDIILTYTGGTTGMPKGVMWPHRAFFFACAGGGSFFNPHGAAHQPADIAQRAQSGYELRLFPVAPLMHAAALWTVWSALLNGVTVVLDDSPSFDPARVWDIAASLNVNIVQIVGDAMAIPLRDTLAANPGRWDLSRLVSFGSGGAVFSAHVKDDLKRLLPGAMITDGMGSSETGISGQAEASGEGLMRLPATPDQQVVIDDRLATIPGETGLLARSGNTPVGYFGDPVKTAEVFRTIEGRLWAVSGDTARLDADGHITVFGRGSTCINSGGEKIFAEEVEEALRAHPAILDAVVVGAPDERWGQRVVAIVSPREPDTRPPDETVRQFLRAHLAGYKLPKDIIWVPQVKRSAAGKQDYGWAREQLPGG
jgi:fatty-acyl-CoA synthase